MRNRKKKTARSVISSGLPGSTPSEIDEGKRATLAKKKNADFFPGVTRRNTAKLEYSLGIALRRRRGSCARFDVRGPRELRGIGRSDGNNGLRHYCVRNCCSGRIIKTITKKLRDFFYFRDIAQSRRTNYCGTAAGTRGERVSPPPRAGQSTRRRETATRR